MINDWFIKRFYWLLYILAAITTLIIAITKTIRKIDAIKTVFAISKILSGKTIVYSRGLLFKYNWTAIDNYYLAKRQSQEYTPFAKPNPPLTKTFILTESNSIKFAAWRFWRK